MKNGCLIKGLVAVFFMLNMLLTGTAFGQDVTFSTSDAGVTNKSITEWGIEVVQWNSGENARLSKAYMGEDEIDVLWSFFEPSAALDSNMDLVQEHIDVADGFIDGGAAALLPNAAFGFGPNIGGTDAYFFPGGTFDCTRWYNLVKKTVEYYESRGRTVAHMMPFNEPDWWAGTQGSPADLGTVAQLLADDSSLDGIGIMGPSVLSSQNAWYWYTDNGAGGASGPLTHGSTHHLQWYDSASAIADFYTYDVLAHGDIPYNPEFHSMGEAIFSAEYGVTGGAWWGAALRARGLFVQACQGDRLGYAENRGGWSTDYLTQSAAAVYRAPDGELYAFAGGFERAGDFGSRNNYRLVCTDRDVYFNGIGPMREYVLPVRQFEDAFVNIDFDTDIMPALDGHRWKIVNRYNGKVIAVAGSGTAEGDDIQMETDTDSLNQKWDIIRNKDGYYKLFNANSGMPMDNYGWSTWDNGDVRQWSDTGGFNQYWFIENAGSGYYHIRNGHGTLYVDGYNTSVIQWSANGQTWQEWEFVLADEAGSGTPTAVYEFEGNANDSASSNDGSTTGSPAYTAGQTGQAIDLDGADDYVTLPSGIANADDITIAAWVNWDGGTAQQRIFDFGDDTTNYFFLTPSDFNNQLHCGITTGSYQYEDGLITDALPVGQWVHVAVTLRGNTGILYINGSPKVTGYIGLDPSDFNPTVNYIGKSQWSDPLFNGQIDDFRIYDYALSAAEISHIVAVSAPSEEFSGIPSTEPAQTVDLSGEWSFTPDGGSQTTIQVPGGGWFKQGFTNVVEADYETTISVPNIGEPQMTHLTLGAVNYEAILYVDGAVVSTNVQAYTPASWDLSNYVTPGSSHDIRVHVKSMGARMYNGRSIDPNGAGSWAFDDAANPTHTFLAQGIFRSAELKIYPKVYIAGVFVRPSVQDAELYYDVQLHNGSATTMNVTLSGTLDSWNGETWSYPSLPDQVLALQPGTTNITVGPVSWTLGADSYWWPNVPYQAGYTAQLHNLNLSLAPTAAGDAFHTNSTRFGFRECTQASDGDNTCYFLNGARVNFRGDSLQGANYDRIDYGGQGDAYDTYPGFLPGANGWPKAVDNYQRLNYNFVRIHQIPASPYMLDVCDEMGLMLMDETGIRGAGDQQDFTAGRTNMVNHVKALFSRDRNHASIIRLSIANEPDWSGSAGSTSADYVQFILDLYDAAMEVDQTRPISIDTGAGSYDEITYANFSVYPHYGASHTEWGHYTDEVYARSDRPYGCGEFIWDADNTKQGFAWFATATQAMRAKGASDTRPYTLLSAWSSIIPGTSTSDMRLENPPWNTATLYPLYGENNLPDPWSNPQIQRVQAGFNPVLVADAEYWEAVKHSNSNGDWPANVPCLTPNQSVTRTLNIYNDTFSNTSVDVSWELRQGSASGTILDSGVVNATVPLGYMANEDISFTTPDAPAGTLVYLVFYTEKDGQELFRESDQVFVLAESISLENPGFELPAAGKIPDGFDGSTDVPGWNDYGNMTDSGIEAASFAAHGGDYAAYLMAGDGGAYQMTGYTIQEGDIFALGYWAKIDWADSTCAMTGVLFWDTPNSVPNEIGWYAADPLGREWAYYECTVTATVASVGHELGISFVNSQTDWAALDDVTLTVISAGDAIAPAAPLNLSATAGDGSVDLDWDDNIESDLASYTLYRSTTSGSNYVAIASGLATSTNTDSTVTNGTTYYYVVTAKDANSNESAFSSEASVVPSVDVAPEESYIAGTAVIDGTNLSLTVSNSVLGHDYWILATDTLTPAVWSNILVEAGSGSNLLFDIPIDPASTNRYFKLDVERQ